MEQKWQYLTFADFTGRVQEDGVISALAKVDGIFYEVEGDDWGQLCDRIAEMAITAGWDGWILNWAHCLSPC